MKKYLGCLAVMILAVFILSACSTVEATDIPTPINTIEATNIPTSTSTIEATDIPIPTPTNEVKERDLSTPSSRLVGHWRAINTPSMSEYYFGEIDEKTGEGTFAEYGITSGKIYKDTYKVISETPDGEDITITVLPFEDIHTSINIAKDGLTAILMDFTIEYIDDKTEFEPEK